MLNISTSILKKNVIMKESIHQEFERFMRDEMDDSEREKYIKSKNYQTMISLLTDTLKKFKKNKIIIMIKKFAIIILFLIFIYYV